MNSARQHCIDFRRAFRTVRFVPTDAVVIALADVLVRHATRLLDEDPVRVKAVKGRRRIVVMDHAVMDFFPTGEIKVGWRGHDSVIRLERNPINMLDPCWGWRWLRRAARDWAHGCCGYDILNSGWVSEGVARLAWRWLRGRFDLGSPLSELVKRQLRLPTDVRRIAIEVGWWPIAGIRCRGLSSTAASLVGTRVVAFTAAEAIGSWAIALYADICKCEYVPPDDGPMNAIDAALSSRGVDCSGLVCLRNSPGVVAIVKQVLCEHRSNVTLIDCVVAVLRAAAVLGEQDAPSYTFMQTIAFETLRHPDGRRLPSEMLRSFAQYVQTAPDKTEPTFRYQFTAVRALIENGLLTPRTLSADGNWSTLFRAAMRHRKCHLTEMDAD